MTELCKAQCQQNFAGNHQTDELIQKIDQAGKLSELPEKAFDNLMNYRGKQLNFNEKTIESLKKIEKKATLTEQEKSSLAYEIASNPHHISQLPQESKKNVDETFSNKNEEMKKFFELIEPEKLSSHVKSELPIYEQLLSRIENGQKPSDHELQKLDILHDELVRYNMLDAMPNRAQSFLENYQTEQELKQKAPHNAYQLLEKLKAEQPLKVFEAFYLSRYMPKEKQETHPIYGVTNFYKEINKTLENLPQDVRDKASEAQELVDEKAIKLMQQVIDQIKKEERRITKEGIEMPHYGLTLKLTSNFMEIRMTKEFADKLADETVKQLLAGKLNTEKEEIFRFHEGIDSTAHYESDGKITYQYGFKARPEIAKIFKVTPSDNHTVTILEYHPDHGVLLTKFRHVQKLYRNLGDDLQQGQEIGTYAISEKKPPYAKEDLLKKAKEHGHIERRLAKPEYLNDFTSGEKFNLEKFSNVADDVVRLVQPMIEGNDYHSIALFSPNSALNKQFLNMIEQNWLIETKDSLENLQKNNSLSTDEIIKHVQENLNGNISRDILWLETIIAILQKLQTLLAEVGTRNDDIDKLIQDAKQTALDLDDILRPKQTKVIKKS